MSAAKDNQLLAYKEECFKQTMPYAYELAYMSEGDGTDQKENLDPAPSGRIILFPDDNANILNFEGINEEYVIFVDRRGVCEPDMVRCLTLQGMGADIVYPDEDFTTDTGADLSDVNVRIRTLRKTGLFT